MPPARRNTRGVGRPASVEAGAARTAAPGAEPRGARRRRETRRRLLDAALELMASRGPDGVAIQEITERADVGFGSFYNHFESKEAIHAALVDDVYEAFGATLDRITAPLVDPAEVLAASVRYTLRRGRAEPLWGRLLVRMGFSPQELTRGLGARLIRDLERGVAAGRFVAPDRLMTFVAVGSAVLGALAAELELGARDSDATSLARSLGAEETAELPERAAAVVLRLLGLSSADAEEVARRPLPLLLGGARLPDP